MLFPVISHIKGLANSNHLHGIFILIWLSLFGWLDSVSGRIYRVAMENWFLKIIFHTCDKISQVCKHKYVIIYFHWLLKLPIFLWKTSSRLKKYQPPCILHVTNLLKKKHMENESSNKNIFQAFELWLLYKGIFYF